MIITHIISSVVFLLVLPFAIVFYLSFWFWRQLIYLIVKFKFEDVFKPTDLDVLASTGSDLSKAYYNLVYQQSGTLDIEKIRNHFNERIFQNSNDAQKEISKKWQSTLVPFCGYFFWVKSKNFNIKNHIKLINMEDLYNEEEMKTNITWESLASRITSVYGTRDVQWGVPKWQIYVLQYGKERYTSLFKIHHSICDGLHALRLFKEILVDEYKPPERQPLPKQSLLSKIRFALWSFSLLPYGLYASAVNKDSNPLHGPKLTGKKNFHTTKKLSLEQLKKLKPATNATVNDIVVSAVSKGITQHFQNRCATVPQVTSLLPISRHIHEDVLKMKNNISLSSVVLPTQPVTKDLCPEPIKTELMKIIHCTERDLLEFPSLMRLLVVQKNLNDAKENPLMMSIGWFMMTVSGLLPLNLAQKILFMDGLTTNISNLNGPQNKDYAMAGGLVEDGIFFLNDKDPLGFAVSVFSVIGDLRIGIIADEGLMSRDEGHKFIENVTEELTNIENEVSKISPELPALSTAVQME